MEVELKVRVQLSVQRALLGMIYPSIRGIAIGFEDDNELEIVCYLDRQPNENDYETMSDISGDILADIEFKNTVERCEFNLAPFSSLDALSFWAYMRKE